MPHRQFIDEHVGRWNQIADETIKVIGEEESGCFVNSFSHLIDLRSDIADVYTPDELLDSLTMFEIDGLCKETVHLHCYLLWGHYPVVLARLRFNWERIFRAVYADAYGRIQPGRTDGPGSTIDDKHEWLGDPKRRLDWRSVIEPVLSSIFSRDHCAEIVSDRPTAFLMIVLPLGF
jgi:hypothetical protein